VTATTSPNAARAAARRTGAPLTVTCPLAIHACTRVRVAAPTSVRWRSQLLTRPSSFFSTTDWTPLALSNLVSLGAIVLAWVFAEASSRGELMGTFTTMAGIAFAVHSIYESMRNASLAEATSWQKLSTPLREVRPIERKAA